MAQELERLVVALEADMSQYSAAMAQVGQQAEQATNKIISEFSKANASVSGLISTGFGLGAGIGLFGVLKDTVIGVIDYIQKLSQEFIGFEETARQAGLSLANFQALRIAAQQQGVSGDKFDKDIVDLAKGLNEALRGENDLSKILDANNVKWKVGKDEVISTNKALEIAADLVGRAANEQDKLAIVSKLGLDDELIPFLQQGSAAIRQAAQAAKDAGGVVDAELIQRAAKFDSEWHAAIVRWSTTFKAEAFSVAQYLSSTIGSTLSVMERKAEAFNINQKLGSTNDLSQLSVSELGLLKDIATKGGAPLPAGYYDALHAAEEAQRQFNTAQGLTGLAKPDAPQAPIPRLPGPTTIIPPDDKKKKTSSESEANDAYDEERISIEKKTEALRIDAEVQGMSTEAAARFRAEQELTNAALRTGDGIDETTRKEIEALSQKYAEAAQQVQHLKDVQLSFQAANQYANSFFNDLIVNGTTAQQALSNLLKKIASDLLQFAFTGQGTFAPILGQSYGQTGGLFGSLLGGLVHAGGPPTAPVPFATGGTIEPGGWAMTGEEGPELIRAGRSPITVQPMRGGASQSVDHHIYIHPSDMFTVRTQRITRTMIADNNRAGVPAAVNNAQQRYG